LEKVKVNQNMYYNNYYRWLKITPSSKDHENNTRDQGVKEIKNPKIKGPIIQFLNMDVNQILC
jgi:hypothetical protein